MFLHLADTLLHDPFDGSTPAGVEDSDSTIFGVHQYDRQAVGGEHGQQYAGRARDQAIAGQRYLRKFRNQMNNIGMRLADRYQLNFRSWPPSAMVLQQSGDIGLAILFYRGTRVFSCKTQIERAIAVCT